MFKLPLFGEKKLKLAFEYAVILLETARKQDVEVTPELIEKAEAMIINEFKTKTPMELSLEMIPNILSIFELDLSK